ncbi:two-component sensor histidine kinase [Sulfurimicrobium lacus]|uniref:histidine kinase n=1 Tax=Sulfurimicrobium lacus TaxID=2715678 RepID=A0A6F8VF11_9PROT|nr:ATP-binding protein [Sulfurimicrobium lacus]BCB27930.1 two-component sensor histidine kinase [Sulfurimicrobium lacus]
MKLQSSLRQKITLGYLGYYVMALLIVALSLFTFLELRVIDNRVVLGERITALFDATLEIRRFEKNYFLYHQDTDLQESKRYAAKVIDLIEHNTADFAKLASAPRILALQNEVRAYRELMAEYARSGADDTGQSELLEAQIRKAGKGVVTIAEEMAGTERRRIRASLDRFRSILVASIVLLSLLMIAVGWALSRMVVRPLKHMDSCVEAVSGGRLDKLTTPSEDSEIIAITQAFNHMLGELELRQKMLLRSEKLASLGTMLAGVAHELNNPLSNISLSAQILLEEIEENDPERRQELLAQIEEQTERARNIVRALLDFARDKPVKREDVLLAPLIEEVILFLRGETPSDVRITSEIAADIALPADRQRLEQAFLNLIKNALEEMGGTGEIRISATRRHLSREAAVSLLDEGAKSLGKCFHGGDAVDIEIRDNGPGIPDEILPRIFDPFFTTKDVGRGMGLGLFIVYEIIEEHNGCISVESEAGRGTVFHIRLPLEHIDEENG